MLVFNLLSAFGAKATEKVTLKEALWLLIYGLLLILVSVPSIVVVILALCVSRYINGFIWTVISAETNKQIASAERATVLSFINLATEVLPMVIDPVIAMSYDKYGFPITYRILAFFLFLFVAIALLARRKKKI